MSVDYRVHIKRNKDNTEVASFIGNHLKTIFDSEFCDKIHCNGRFADAKRFTTEDLNNITKSAEVKVNSVYNEIAEKKFMIMGAANVNIKHELEEEIQFLKTERLEELNDVLYSSAFLVGMIRCLVEDRISDDDRCAYEYNGTKVKNEDGSEKTEFLWVDDVYCEIEALY